MSIQRLRDRLEALEKLPPRASTPPPEDGGAWPRFLEEDQWAKPLVAELDRRVAQLSPAAPPTTRQIFDDPECSSLLERLYDRFTESDEVTRIRAGEAPQLPNPANLRNQLWRQKEGYSSSSEPDHLWRLLVWAQCRGFDTSTLEGCSELLDVLRQERSTSPEWANSSGWGDKSQAWLALKLHERALEERALSPRLKTL